MRPQQLLSSSAGLWYAFRLRRQETVNGTKPRIHALFLTAILVVAAGVPMAAQRGGRSTPVPSEVRATAGFDPAESAGLFVGIRLFKDEQLAEIPYAVDDAVDLAHLFALELELIAPEKVALALSGEPQKEVTQDHLKALLEAGASRAEPEQSDFYALLEDQTRATGPMGVLVLSIATHGFSDQGGQYLAAADSRFNRITRTGIAVNEVFDEVERAGTERRIVLLDACRERLSSDTRAGGADPLSAMSQAFADALSQAQGQVVMSGTTLGGYSYDDHDRGNGVFSAAVIDGLRGDAPANDRSLITAETLAGFVDGRVRSWVQIHRSGHATVSQGIETTFGGAAADLPLAADATGLEEARELAERRAAALDLLARTLAQSDLITAEIFGQVKSLLKTDPLGPEEIELMDWIEALEDGSERSQKALLNHLKILGTEDAPPPAAEPVGQVSTASLMKIQIGVSRLEARYGVPDADQYLIRRQYIVGYSYRYRQPLWTLELLESEIQATEGEEVARMDTFREDPEIPEQYRATLDDYRRSGYDRGHLVSPSNWNQRAVENSESFLLSNMAPQAPAFNRQIWRKLEIAVKDLAMDEQYLAVYVINGPLFNAGKAIETIGENEVAVPHAFFKSILAENKRGRLQIWTFAIPNEKATQPLAEFLTSVSEVERRSTLLLWSGLRGADADRLRQKTEKMWGE